MVVFTEGKEGAKITGIYSRGDGEIGGNLTYLKEYIDFPEVKDSIVVRGEFILPKIKWEKYAGSYANARSFVSAKINGGHVSPAFGDIDFVAYSIVDWPDAPKDLTPDRIFKILDALGFKTPVNGVIKDPLVFDLVAEYTDRRTESEYNIDGLVIQAGEPPKAFKMLLEEQLRDTVITNVDWNITRYGRYFPVAVYEAVYVDGVRLHRASAHNADHVQSWYLGKGTKIKVARSGDVIPQIKDVTVDANVEPIFPEKKWPWHWERKDIILDIIDDNTEVQIKRITHFFGTIKVPQLGEGRVRKLHDAGLTSIEDITKASKADLQKIRGFGAKLSEQVYTGIHDTMQKTRMDRFLVASTSFKTRIGRKLLKQVLREYPEIFSDSEAEITRKLKAKKIAGIGAKRIADLAKGIPEFVGELKQLDPEDIAKAIEWGEKQAKKPKNPKITNKTFVLTNFMGVNNYDLEDYLWDNWGNIGTTVVSSTEAVIAHNLGVITPKMLSARKLGVPVYTVEEFFNKYAS